MRKKISCRVIKSVPLNQSEDGLNHAYSSYTSYPKTGSFNSSTHSDIPAMMRIYTDTGPTTEMLDFWA